MYTGPQSRVLHHYRVEELRRSCFYPLSVAYNTQEAEKLVVKQVDLGL